MNRIRVLCAIAWMHTALFAQAVDFNITGAGARAAGIGQAFIGVADDATAVVWNPSGLTTLDRMEASIVGRQVYDVRDYTDDSYTNIDRLDVDNSHLLLNFVSFAYPIKWGERKVVLAGAYQRQFDLYRKINLLNSDAVQLREGGVDSFTPSLAVQVVPILSIGMASNVWIGKTEFSEENFGKGSYDYSGVNHVIGAMLDFGNLASAVPLKVGFTMRTPFKLKEKGGYDNVASSTNKLKIPVMMGFGASYRFGENLTVATDFETRKYKKTDLGDDDLNQFRAGAEYLWVSDFAVIPLRAGFQTVPTLARDNKDNQIAGTALSLGSGIIFSKFALDIAMVRSAYSYKYDDVDQLGFSKTVKVDVTRMAVNASTIIYF